MGKTVSETVMWVHLSLDSMNYRFNKHGLDSFSISTCQPIQNQQSNGETLLAEVENKVKYKGDVQYLTGKKRIYPG